MSTKFTPGPWVVEPANEPDEGAVVVRYWQDGDKEIRVTPQIIASVECDEVGDGSIPNAQLIAAAPDLYAALQRLLEREWVQSDSGWYYECPFCIERMKDGAVKHWELCPFIDVRAALAKARGGEVSE